MLLACLAEADKILLAEFLTFKEGRNWEIYTSKAIKHVSVTGDVFTPLLQEREVQGADGKDSKCGITQLFTTGLQGGNNFPGSNNG